MMPDLPALSSFLPDLDHESVAAGAWDDDFLTVGGRLRRIFGNDVALDLASATYHINGAGSAVTRVRCSVTSDGTRMVIIDAGCVTTSFRDRFYGERAMIRARALLYPMQVSVQEGCMSVHAEIPFGEACGHRLADAVREVRRTSMRLRAVVAESVDRSPRR